MNIDLKMIQSQLKNETRTKVDQINQSGLKNRYEQYQFEIWSQILDQGTIKEICMGLLNKSCE